MINKKIFDSSEKKDKHETDIIKGTQVGQNVQISYLISNHFINEKICTFLIIKGYGKSSQLRNFELYFMGNQKILILNNINISLNKDKNTIEFINEQNIFIPEYILDYNNIQLPQLSLFYIIISNHFVQIQKEKVFTFMMQII